jgi:hypothetical protein
MIENHHTYTPIAGNRPSYWRNERTKDRRYTPKPTAPSSAPTLRSNAPTSSRREYCRSSHRPYPKKNSTAAEIRILWAVVTDTTHLQTAILTLPAKSPHKAPETPPDPAPFLESCRRRVCAHPQAGEKGGSVETTLACRPGSRHQKSSETWKEFGEPVSLCIDVKGVGSSFPQRSCARRMR